MNQNQFVEVGTGVGHIPGIGDRGTGPEVTTEPVRLVVVNGGTSNPSTSRMLAMRVADKTRQLLTQHKREATVQVIDLGPLADEISQAIVTGQPHGELLDAIRQLTDVDGIILTAPIYKAGVSGLFKAFVDVLDNDLLVAAPVVIAATGGTARHALVADDHMRPLMAFMRALPTPTSVFAAPEDWGDAALGKRIERAATELAAMIRSDVRRLITEQAWGGYQHGWGSPTRQGADLDVEFESDFMRLAAGGARA